MFNIIVIVCDMECVLKWHWFFFIFRWNVLLCWATGLHAISTAVSSTSSKC